jgi:hypothetical protein
VFFLIEAKAISLLARRLFGCRMCVGCCFKMDPRHLIM